MLTTGSYNQDGSDTKSVGSPDYSSENPCYAYIHVPMISEPWNITDRYHYNIRTIMKIQDLHKCHYGYIILSSGTTPSAKPNRASTYRQLTGKTT